ncbi:MAG: hypothetical protein EHM16_06655 [Betaproteobacteria bacterium]|nr:MAG: hypothetical protein EHM16_06655 [Betaproteobacteria bacterium]
MQAVQRSAAMYKETLSKGNLSGIVVALIVLALGVILSFAGLWIIGVPVAILALFMGGKRIKVWKCSKCGYFFERA